ncbi:MAG: GAF domain-containing protein [Anaerolineales bacterium]|nr:GAF domain-containing protein [Anaerolineales bacterium]
MKQPSDPNIIQEQLWEVSNLLSNAMMGIAKTSEGQGSQFLRDLTQAVSTLNKVKSNVSKQIQTHETQFDALVRIGSAINSSLGLKRVLAEVMDRLVSLMRAERGFLMLRESDGNLKVHVARGIDNVDLNEDEFAVSKTVINRVVETGKLVLTTNAQEDPRFEAQFSVAAYHLLSILCVPLNIKDKLIGVIYVDNRAHTGVFQQENFDLISAFANQAAIAIHNARLFDDLQASNEELEIAYQATLEGWVRALDLRDKETEGHTKRVTSLTQTLARGMGLKEDEIIHITRGALLHDIGKMAIPDGILLKPDKLSEDERALIEKHPRYAYEMLNPIKFLHPALDIPYCHHEKWDGSGYPRKLKGEDIPFAARIFAVVDVWDALVSDRPYRKGIQPSEVKKSIRELSGSHFDPRVVDAFLSLDDLATMLRKLKTD